MKLAFKKTMNPTFQRLMREATRLTSTGNLRAATAAIQRALAGEHYQAPAGSAVQPAERVVVKGLLETPLPQARRAPEQAFSQPPLDGGEFTSGSHKHAGLTRAYKLFVPSGAGGNAPLPLVVMLHGCKQNPDDFAAGTGMNELAQQQGFLVLYPAQSSQANPAGCWNWFKHNHQGRSSGEAAVIASMTQAVLAQHGGDPDRVYIAGLSAGGAMASLVAAANPELFAAVGVHSGLAPGAAQNLPEGLAAMREGAAARPGLAAAPRPTLRVPTIVFHGDRDTTVHPKNGEQVVAAALAGALQRGSQSAREPVQEQGASAQGQRYTRTVHGEAPAVVEHWLLRGAGHAWSGGQSAGSYTDPQGPDASREMLRFFFSQVPPKAH